MGLFKTDLAYETWKKKYQFGDETEIETFQRVAKSLASVEKDPKKWEQEFFKTMVKIDKEEAVGLKFTPGGRITSNAGTTFGNATLMNCFISGPVQNAQIKYKRKLKDIESDIEINTPETSDDLINIFLTITEQAKTLASEGGYGINFDFIRPRGSLIKGTGIKHPGIVAYMEVWDAVANCIVRGTDDGYIDSLKNYLKDEFEEVKNTVKKMTRKGAMMGALSVDHPDIEEFIRAKQESGKLTKFNISVAITDDFMKAVQKDSYFELKFDGVVYKKVKARDLYDLIMKSTYNRGEPGVIFVDNAQLNNPIAYLGRPNCTNPCVLEGTLVSTKNGLKPVEMLNVGDEIQTTLGFGPIKNIYKYENQDIYRVHFSDGFYQDVTKGHIYYTQLINENSRKRWNNDIRLTDIKENKFFVKKEKYKFIPNGDKKLTRDDGLLIGLYFGDGSYSNYQNFNICVNSNENNVYIKDLYNRLGFKIRIDESEGNCQRYYATYNKEYLDNLFKKLEINPNDKFNIKVENFINSNKNFISGLIDGLISSDGNVTLKSKYPMVRFKNISYNLHILLYHLMLLVGADYKIYIAGHKGEKSKIYERTVFRTNDIYEGVILNDSILNLYSYINFLSHKNKNTNLKNIIQFTSLTGCKWKSKIVKIEKIGIGTVYDLYEKNADDWNCCGYVSRGCGEIPGLHTLTTVCLLGSFNLVMYIYLDENGNPQFDYETYKYDLRVATRMLDNVNDLTKLPLPSYENSVKNLRQIGIGLNGLGSALIMLGIPYNSRKAVQFVKELNRLKENITMETSSLLAKEKGCFPLYNQKEFCETEYFKSDRLNDDTKSIIKTFGLRNAKTTTNPPLGNSSVICNVSNGIEPIFSLETERKVICQWPEGLNNDNVRKILTKKKRKDFVYWEGIYNDQKYYYEPHNRGLCEVHIIRDSGYQWLLDNFPEKKKEKFVVTTKDLNIDDHLAIQEVTQYYCNQSVSKTANLPNKYPFEDFKNLYMKAWKKKLVGFTTYREGSMESVLESFEKAEIKKEIIKDDLKLPYNFLNGPTTAIKREGMKFYIHFSYLPDDSQMKYPVAMWIHTNAKKETVACNRACKSLTKLALGCGITQKIIDDTWDKCLGDYPHNRLARMISLCLRHNVPREDILVALKDIEGDNISSLLTAVRKFIGNTIEDGTELVGMKCLNPECNSYDLRMESGCFVCLDCGWSGCS